MVKSEEEIEILRGAGKIARKVVDAMIESARPGSFVERFLARRGEGFHHLSIDVADGELDGWMGELEAAGLRIVDRGDYGDGSKAASIL